MTESSTEVGGHTEKKRPESSSYSKISSSVVEVDVSPVSHVTYDYVGFKPIFLNADFLGNGMRANTLRFSYILVKKSRRLWTWL